MISRKSCPLCKKKNVEKHEGVLITFTGQGVPKMPRLRGYKTFVMLNSIEREIFSSRKC